MSDWDQIHGDGMLGSGTQRPSIEKLDPWNLGKHWVTGNTFLAAWDEGRHSRIEIPS